MKHNLLKLFTLTILLFAQPSLAETRYITDEFKVTLRTGSSTSNNIVSMLKSGQAVKVIEHDKVSKYSLVETNKGKQGYVLTRYLKSQPSGRELYAELKVKHEQQIEHISALEIELEALKQQNAQMNSEMKSLYNELSQTSKELEQLENKTRNTLEILNKNKIHLAVIEQLKIEKKILDEENAAYKDRTAMDWFIRGGAVSLIAFLIGIIVTRIRWKKRESWSSL
ncbi:MAG: TIGR04211 family SH3 domain-containing protein [Gammaproteobacteria bacterium]|nr:TIGR04211 family SH3 domain-containing protein [Gammaproteobacteria bacterium]